MSKLTPRKLDPLPEANPLDEVDPFEGTKLDAAPYIDEIFSCGSSSKNTRTPAMSESHTYVCINGHDKCREMYPTSDCPYCEKVHTTPTREEVERPKIHWGPWEAKKNPNNYWSVSRAAIRDGRPLPAVDVFVTNIVDEDEARGVADLVNSHDALLQRAEKAEAERDKMKAVLRVVADPETNPMEQVSDAGHSVWDLLAGSARAALTQGEK